MSAECLVENLQLGQKSFTVRLKILRTGSEFYCGKNMTTRCRKLIMIDSEGVKIGGTIFNDDIGYFIKTLEANKTYLITNGEVKEVHKDYPSVHPKKELAIKKFTNVKEADTDIEAKIQYEFVEIGDVVSKFEKGQFDISGTLAKVEALEVVDVKSKGTISTLRNVMIKNNKSEVMNICLWEDLAKNEGAELLRMVERKPSIAITHVFTKRVFGSYEVHSTSKSVLQVILTNEENGQIMQAYGRCDQKVDAELSLTRLSMTQRMTYAKEVTLKDLLENRHTLLEDASYYFRGVIDRIDNKSSIWYDACKKCKRSCKSEGENKICIRCDGQAVETIPRYRITMNVIEGKYHARVTIFHSIAAVYVGCPVDEYIASIKEGENNSSYYRRLSTQSSTVKRFITALKLANIDDRGNLNITATGFEKVDMVDEENELVDALIEDSNPNENVEKEIPSEKPKRGRPRKTTEVLPTKVEVKDKKKRRITKKKTDVCQEIPSDDDQPLAKFICEMQKKNKRSPIKKINKEKK